MQNLGGKLLVNQNFHSHSGAIKAHAKMGCAFAPAQFWVIKTKYWEFSAHIALAIVSRGP